MRSPRRYCFAERDDNNEAGLCFVKYLRCHKTGSDYHDVSE